MVGPMERLYWLPRPICREFQNGRSAAELFSPVGELPIKLLTLQPLTLPEGKIGILYGQISQRRGLGLHERFIQRANLTKQYTHGPSVTDYVLHGEQEHMLLLVKLQQAGA